MPSDTLLSKLVMESPTAVTVNDHVTTIGAAANYLIVCGFIADAVLCTAAMLFSLVLRPAHQYPTHTLVTFSIAIGLCAALLLQSVPHRLSADEAGPVLYTAAAIRITLQALLILLPGSILLHTVLPRRTTWLALFAMPIALTLERHALNIAWRAIWASRIPTKRVVLLGSVAVGRRLVAKLLSSPGLGLTPVALIDNRETDLDELPQSDYRGVPVLNITPTSNILQSLQCDLLVVANPERDDTRADDATLAADEVGAGVTWLPVGRWRDDLLETNDNIEGQIFAETDVTWYYPLVKRSMDFLLSCLCLVVLSPVFFAIALLIRMESSGPALFIQERVGAGGTRFSMYKFRSMTCNAQPYQRSPTSPEDSRITRVGMFLRRTSLDELPQLLNVFLGQMALVGPRPEMEFIVSQYSAHQRLRLQVVPGITGLWQLSKDRAYPIHQNIHHDLTYIRKRSISLDIAILIHTVLFATRGGV